MSISTSRRTFIGNVALIGAGFGFSRTGLAAAAPGPPIARLEPVRETLFGTTITDPYRWMENPKDQDWLSFVRGQNGYARNVLDKIAVRQNLLRRISQLSDDVVRVVTPRPAGGRVFFERRGLGESDYRLIVRLADGKDRVLADPATFSKPGAPASIDWWMPSPDGKHLVFGVSIGGSEASIGHIINVDTGSLLAERLMHVPYPAISWLPDSSGFFYNRFTGLPNGDPKYYENRTACLHTLATPQSVDVTIISAAGSADVALSSISSPEIQTGIGSDHCALLIRDGYVRGFALYIAQRRDVLAGKARWRKICGADDGIADFALSGQNLFLVATDGSSRGRLLRLDAEGGTLANAKLLLPEQAGVLDELNAGVDGTYITINDGGEQKLVFQPATGNLKPVSLPFTGWIQAVSVSPIDGKALIRISGWLAPPAIFTVDPKGGARRNPLQPSPPVDLSRFEYRRIMAKARDGTSVPISLIARKGSPTGKSPCLVHVYGAYQWPSQPVFDARNLAFLEAGGIVATAHVRGGGEYGRAWHEAGMKAAKPNTWRDLIDCCEALIAEGWTAKGKIAILGGSAGGIAVGRALTERPDLFGAVISKVGMSNPLRAEFEPNGGPNVPEFGSVADEAGFRALLAMDSTQAVEPGKRYPPVLLATGINDPRVSPHNAAKMAAHLQAANPANVALLKVDFEGGHDTGNQPRESVDAEYADDFAFILSSIQIRS